MDSVPDNPGANVSGGPGEPACGEPPGRPDRPAGSVIAVAFDTPVDRTFDYALPADWVGRVQPGQRVQAPFGRNNRPTVGFCVGVPDQWQVPKLKTVLQVIDPAPLVDASLFALARWLSDYYVAPIGRTLAVMVPAAVKRQVGLARRTLVYLCCQVGADASGGASSRRQTSLSPAGSIALSLSASGRGEGLTVDNPQTPDHSNEPSTLTPPLSLPGRGGKQGVARRPSPKQAAAIELLRQAEAVEPASAVEIGELARRAGCTKGPIQQLIAKGIVVAVEQEYLPGQTPPPARLVEPDFQLNDLQRGALARLEPRIEQGGFSATLLHGVTSSGKTEIYLRLIRKALASGRQALVLIPEIALTTQAMDRYRRRLGSVAVIHSGLSDGQRHQAWRRIADGDYQVVLGTMSAVFAPAPRLGLIVVDEEQEPSFKHLKSPRFHARDVAIKRAQLLGIPVVLGSATPALETWHNAQHLQRYDYIELPRRVAEMPMPKVRVVDMRAEAHQRRGVHLFSRLLEQQIGKALAAGRQVLLLLNRRGYASYLFCQSCKFVLVCDRCKSNVIYHRAIDAGLCHRCGRRYLVPERCPVCQHRLIRFGLGTQRVEEELARKFPSARYVRVDRDTMRRVHDYERALGQFEAGQFDVMLGTQMIAKGLDFPNVALVGVVSADTTLAIPDFRSSERTFQLVAQVAGRAGRAARPGGAGGAKGPPDAGRVVIQTLHADLPAIDFALRHDYRGFAELELASRKELGYPPYGRLALFVLRGPVGGKVNSAAGELVNRLESLRSANRWPGRVVGPTVAPVARIRGQFRYHVLLQAPGAAEAQRWLAEARRRGLLKLPVDWIIDVDPLALM